MIKIYGILKKHKKNFKILYYTFQTLMMFYPQCIGSSYHRQTPASFGALSQQKWKSLLWSSLLPVTWSKQQESKLILTLET